MATADPTLLQQGPSVDVSAPEAIKGRTPWELFWYRFRQDKAAISGAIFIILLVLLAMLAPLIADKIIHHGPNDIHVREMTNEFGLPKGPTAQFWFGADRDGRDVFVRVIYGLRTSLVVAIVATGISMVIGVILGVVAGFFGGKIDTLVSRVTDIILAMPLLLFAIGISTACQVTREGCLGGIVKPGLFLVVFIIAIFSWTYIARIIRGQTLSLREREFIEASRSLGAGPGRIMFHEVVPNLVAPIIIYSTLVIPSNILFEAYLSFLGLGIPQTTPSLGRMISDATGLYEVAWWMMVFPGLFLFMTTLAFNLLGDGLRDALDPKDTR